MRVVIAKVINYSSNAKILKNKLQVKKLQITNVKYKSFAVPSRQLLRLRALH